MNSVQIRFEELDKIAKSIDGRARMVGGRGWIGVEVSDENPPVHPYNLNAGAASTYKSVFELTDKHVRRMVKLAAKRFAAKTNS